MRVLLQIGIGISAWWALYFLVRRLPIKPSIQNRLLRVLAVILVVVIAGPDAGIAADGFATLNAIGADLFLASLIVGLQMVPIWYIFNRLRTLFERLDPYFFVPTVRQLRVCPALSSHAVPGFVPLVLVVATAGFLGAMFSGTHHTVRLIGS